MFFIIKLYNFVYEMKKGQLVAALPWMLPFRLSVGRAS